MCGSSSTIEVYGWEDGAIVVENGIMTGRSVWTIGGVLWERFVCGDGSTK